MSEVNPHLPPWALDARMGANFLDPIRLGLALAVMVGHSFDLVAGVSHADPIGQLSHRATSISSLAVDGFFCISGFLIAASFLRSRGWRDYLARRVRRIYPAFAFANLLPPVLVPLLLLPVLFGFAFVSNLSVGKQVAFSLINTALLEPFDPLHPFTLNPSPILNGSLWTIRYEFTCYLLSGVVLMAPKGRRLLAAIALLALTTALRARFPGHSQLASWFSSHLPSLLEQVWQRFFGDFAAGMALFLNRERVPRSRPLAALAFVALVVALVFPTLLPVVVPLALTYLLFFIAFAQPNALIGHFQRMGDLSYGTYLYAFPVQQTVIMVLGPGASSPLAVLSLSLAPTLLLASGSWVLVERWFLRRRAYGPT